MRQKIVFVWALFSRWINVILVILCFHCLDEFLSFLQGSSHTPLKMSSSMFSQILVATWKNYVRSLADFGTHTKKRLPTPVLDQSLCFTCRLL